MAKKHNDTETNTVETPATKVRVSCERLNLRKGANSASDVLYILNRGETLHLLEDRGEWSKVHYPKQNLTGYVMSSFIDIEV